MAGIPFVAPRFVAVDSGGNPYAGAKAYFYVTSTTTPTNVYTTSALSVAHANPVEANAAGLFPEIWLDPSVTYKLTLNDANDVLIYTVDPIVGSEFARLSQANTFTATQAISSADGGALTLVDTDAGSGLTRVQLRKVGATLFLTTLTDGGALSENAVTITQNSSSEATAIALAADAITLNAVNFDFKAGTVSNFKIQSETAANIASAAATINTTDKFAGKLVLDTTNHKLYTARGSGATDVWDLVDGSASVTPS